METFRPGGEFTVGAEDELLLVDGRGEPSPHAAEVIEALESPGAATGLGGSHVAPEIYAAEVEFNTPVCDSAASLADHLARCRTQLAAVGAPAVGTGLHPSAALGDVPLVRSPRYDALAEEFGGVLRTPTAAFQVHVGMPDEEALVRAYRGVRNSLSVLRALGATSPYWHGRDSGLASARGAVVRSYPRVGVPPRLRSYAEYEAAVATEMAAGEVHDYTLVSWEVRPHPRFGTLEVRVMDAQPSSERAAALAALVRGLAHHSAENPPSDDLPSAVVAANDFRAVRHGLDTKVLDTGGRMQPVRDLAAKAIADARATSPASDRALLDLLAASLGEEPEYDRQRRVHADRGMRGLLDDLVARTLGGCDPRLPGYRPPS